MSILEYTALELAAQIRKKEISCREAVEAVFGQIEKQEEGLNCYISLDREDALRQADAAQKRIGEGTPAGPLAGVPAAVKDNICTAGRRTTCASRILSDFIPPCDAFAVKKLKEAGCILIGKTNMDEFAMGSTSETGAFGSVRNPWDRTRAAGGSSGGSAAAVAAGECFLALGSDTGGSIRQPAGFCGIVGMKPTYGTVSRNGLIAYGSSLDQIGPPCRDVADCAARLEAISDRVRIGVPLKILIWVEGSRRGSLLHTSHHSFPVRDALYQLEQRLPRAVFTRCQRSFVVNLTHVREIAGSSLLLNDGTQISIGRGSKSDVLAAYRQFRRLRYGE